MFYISLTKPFWLSPASYLYIKFKKINIGFIFYFIDLINLFNHTLICLVNHLIIKVFLLFIILFILDSILNLFHLNAIKQYIIEQ